MPTLAELIADYHARRLALPAMFEALSARGMQAEDTTRSELALVDTMATEGRLDPELAKALSARLRSLQMQVATPRPAPADVPNPAPAPAAPADDATQVRVAPRAAAPSGDEATMVLPASRPPASGPAPGGAIESTLVLPASQPSLSAPAVATGGDSHGSQIGASTWAQVAAAEGGERATTGMLLKGRFQLEREIGRGGMGVVFVARDERKVEARDRDPYVAVKVLNDEFRRHPDSLIALQRESRRAQQLAHDNIVRVYDFDKDGSIVYMTMEYIDGTDLRSLIREHAARGMPLAEARPLIVGMANALQRAHAAGVVHSDFKPGNVMVTKAGVAKVFDFGIARAGKRMGEATGEETVFDAGTLGALTPAYASLEMIQGKPPTPADDIYALGCITFELLTGRHPFDKQSAEVALRSGRKPPPVPGLSKRQYKTLCDAVAFHAEQRVQHAADFVEGLREIGWREHYVRPLAWVMAGVLLLGVAGWIGFNRWQAHQVASVAARFEAGAPQGYADEDAAYAALASLSAGERQQLMLAHGDTVQAFLLGRVDAYWNPAKGRRDYAAAQKVFAIPARLQMFLPQLDLRHTSVEQEKQALEHPVPSPEPAPVAAVPVATAPVGATSVAATPMVGTPAPAAENQANDAAVLRMREAVVAMLREGERNIAAQRYSAAIANAQAALQLAPDNIEARRLLRRARREQLKAMQGITIH